MLTAPENDLLCRVEGDAPMGCLFLRHWIPVCLLEEVLDAWERSVVDHAINQVESKGGDARVKLRRLFALASSIGDLLKIELAIRDWARRDTAVAKRLRRVDNRRMDYLRLLFGALCPGEDDMVVGPEVQLEGRAQLRVALLGVQRPLGRVACVRDDAIEPAERAACMGDSRAHGVEVGSEVHDLNALRIDGRRTAAVTAIVPMCDGAELGVARANRVKSSELDFLR